MKIKRTYSIDLQFVTHQSLGNIDVSQKQKGSVVCPGIPRTEDSLYNKSIESEMRKSFPRVHELLSFA